MTSRSISCVVAALATSLGCGAPREAPVGPGPVPTKTDDLPAPKPPSNLVDSGAFVTFLAEKPLRREEFSITRAGTHLVLAAKTSSLQPDGSRVLSCKSKRAVTYALSYEDDKSVLALVGANKKVAWKFELGPQPADVRTSGELRRRVCFEPGRAASERHGGRDDRWSGRCHRRHCSACVGDRACCR